MTRRGSDASKRKRQRRDSDGDSGAHYQEQQCRSHGNRHFKDVRKLGEGGQCNVWLCRDMSTNRLVVVKRLRRPSPRSRGAAVRGLQPAHTPISCRDRANVLEEEKKNSSSSSSTATSAAAALQWEADVLRALEQGGVTGVVRLEHVGLDPDGNVGLIALRYCEGGDLAKQLSWRGQLEEREALEIVRSLANTLRRCHWLGVMHRDVKPQNVFLRVQHADAIGEEDVVLGDFGHACAVPEQKLSERVGTSAYMAPEVILGSYDARADVWSLGVLLHLLLTSTLPFAALRGRRHKPDSVREAILKHELSLASHAYSHISCTSRELLLGMLRKDPLQRFTMEQVYDRCNPNNIRSGRIVKPFPSEE